MSSRLPARAGLGPVAERHESTWRGADHALRHACDRISMGWRLRRAALERRVKLVTRHDDAMVKRSDLALTRLARNLAQRLRLEGLSDELVACGFALVRELSDRLLGMRHHEVQLMGGWVMLEGGLAEMETGEGKTLTAVLPASLAALAGIPVHVVTANDYLVSRDAKELGPIYEALGLSSAAIVEGTNDVAGRRSLYGCDVVYCTNKQLVSDYLRDQVELGAGRRGLSLQIERLWRDDPRADRLMMRGLRFAIVDEADSLLVDEARTPVILSRTTEIDDEQRAQFERAIEWARGLREGVDFRLRHREVELTPLGEERMDDIDRAGRGLSAHHRYRRELAIQGLSALHAFERDRDYLVRDGRVEIIDPLTGRVMADRSWERGLHQMIEAKEGCALTGQRETIARISYQRFFRRYLKLAGMTGTAREVSRELWRVYGLHVVRVPTICPSRRVALPRRVYLDSGAQWQAVAERVRCLYEKGRPVLVGTSSVAASEALSRVFREAGLPHAVLNARQDRREAELVARAGDPSRITVATGMAGRGTDIRLPETVVRLGGLHVVVTQLGEARRVDRQLRGRCARQGDPGSAEDLLSWDDPLARSFYGPRLHRLLKWILGRSPSSRAALPLMLLPQVAAELRYARSRRALLRLDERLGTVLAFSGAGD